MEDQIDSEDFHSVGKTQYWALEAMINITVQLKLAFDDFKVWTLQANPFLVQPSTCFSFQARLRRCPYFGPKDAGIYDSICEGPWDTRNGRTNT